jgi:hypothetical protein
MTEANHEDALSRIVEPEAPDEFDDDGLYLAETQEFEEEAEALRLEDRRELLRGKNRTVASASDMLTLFSGSSAGS